MATSNLYIYKPTYKLTISNDGHRLEGQMYNNSIKVHKGIDDTITFNVYDDSRRPANINNVTLSLNVIDANSGISVLNKIPIVHPQDKGKFDVKFNRDDVANLDAGLYEYSVIITTVEGDTSVAYTDLSQTATGVIELIDDILPDPANTVVVSSFTINGTRHESYAFNAKPNRSYQSSLNTYAVYLTNYSGKFYFEGSHDMTAPSNWFVVDLQSDNQSIDFNLYASKSGIDPGNFEISTNWFRIVHVPDGTNVGTVDKVLIRS
jgi:hypothetical protein